MAGPVNPAPSNGGDLAQQAAILTAITTHPAILEMLREVEAVPEPQRMQKAEQLATVDAMKARGIPVPAGVRLTTRYFEDPNAPQIQAQIVSGGPAEPVAAMVQAAGTSICASLGFFFCVSVGRNID